MTIEDKRSAVNCYCDRTNCTDCLLVGQEWEHKHCCNCLQIGNATEEELDKALKLISGVIFEKEIDKLKAYEATGLTPEKIREIDRLYAEKCKEVAELQKELANFKGTKAHVLLEVHDYTALCMAYAICKYYMINGETEKALINLEELSKHINAYVKAERKALHSISWQQS